MIQADITSEIIRYINVSWLSVSFDRGIITPYYTVREGDICFSIIWRFQDNSSNTSIIVCNGTVGKVGPVLQTTFTRGKVNPSAVICYPQIGGIESYRRRIIT